MRNRVVSRCAIAAVVLFGAGGALTPAAANASHVNVGMHVGGLQPSVLVGVSFTDVPSTSKFYTEINWTASQRISTGWIQPDGTRIYQPLWNVNRDAMAAFMYRLQGSPEFTPPTVSPFTDITTSTQFYKEICWLASKGITTGYLQPDGTRTYQPLNPVNRDAMAAFMYRLAGSPAYYAPVVSPFGDITRMTQFYKEITWLAAQGISTGYPQADGSKVYSPVNPVARDAMAAFMYRYSHLPAPTPLTISTTELPQATVGMEYQATVSASGGSAPYTWAQSGLPSGLTLDAATGQISGTPTAEATAPITFTVTDYQGHQQNFSTSLTVVRAEFSNVASVAASGNPVTYALKKDGTVWSWGGNAAGSLPTQKTGVSGVASIRTSFEGSTYALKSDGTLWAWGGNSYGQLGNGSTGFASAPSQVQGLTNVAAITENDYSAYAVKADGTAWAWGWNSYGALGIGTTGNAATPVQITGLAGVRKIVAVNSMDLNSAYALLSDGTVWAWGYGVKGTTDYFSTTPVKVAGLGSVQDIAAANGSAYALQTDGTVWSWGNNSQGRLGDGSTTTTTTPVQVRGLSSVASITATGSSAYAITTDGSVWAWGSNGSGQLGNGTFTSSSSPVQIPLVTDAVNLAVSDTAAFAVTTNGVWQWGDGTTTPAQVPGLASVQSVAAGSRIAFAVQSDGTVWAWGDNTYGALGDGTTASSSTPVRVGG